MLEYIPSIISAIGTIIAAWFAYNQYTKNKLTDLKLSSSNAKKKRKALVVQTILLLFMKVYGIFYMD